MSNCNEVLKTVQNQFDEVLKSIENLPACYKYKVREMLSCAETVISMYCDVQNGLVPEETDVSDAESIESTPSVDDEVNTKVVLDVGDIKLPL